MSPNNFISKIYRNILPIGFTLVILMMVSSSFFIASQMKARSELIIQSVEYQNFNNEQLGTMSHAVLNRLLIITEMLRTDDPFKNDELFLEMNELGTEFSVARAKYESQDLAPRLKKLLDTQGHLMRINGPMLTNLYELIQEEKKEKALSIFNDVTLPRLKINLNLIKDMSENQYWLAEDSLQHSKKDINDTIVTAIIIGLISILISIFLTLYILNKQRINDNKLALLASTDTLTKLPNRLSFINSVDRHIENNPSSTFAIVFFDIDYFKSVNDNYGHEVGDEILRLFSEKINSQIKDGDILSRFGGDEFVLLLQSIKSEKEARTFVRLLSTSLDTSFIINKHEIFISSSIGASLFSTCCSCNFICDDPKSLLKHADIAMYSAKQAGRNCFRFFSKEASDKMERDHAVCHALHTILKSDNINDELYLKYQPLLNIENGDFTECEALLRWTNSDGENILADNFIPLAEKNNLIERISLFVIDEVCKQQSEWQETGTKNIRININLSGNKRIFKNLLERFIINMKKLNLDPSLFGIELTERTLNEISEETIQEIDIIRKQGMKISIDDFGTGYSSLSYLKKLPITTLKIDKAFITGLPDDKDDRSLVKAIITLGHSLNLEIVAEGVETYEQLQFLRDHSCNIAQGYYFHRPLKGQQISQLKLVA